MDNIAKGALFLSQSPQTPLSKIYFHKLCMNLLYWDTPIVGGLLNEWKKLVKEFEGVDE